MEQERELTNYRTQLLQALKLGLRRSACGSSDAIQVFVNQRRVGLLTGADATLHMQNHTRIDTVQLRTEDGILLGGLCAPEDGFRISRIPLAGDSIELRVHNNEHGGSVSAVVIPTPSIWHRVQRTWAGLAANATPSPSTAAVPGMRAFAFTHALLAIMVVGLAAERFVSRTAPALVTQTDAPWAAPLVELTTLKQQLADLAQLQAKAVDTIQTQQQGMTQLQRSMAKLSSTQETVASSVLTVKQEIEKRHSGSDREVQRMAHLLMSKSQTEQQQLEAEIHSLMTANDTLSKGMVDLEQHNLDLKKRLKSAGIEVSKNTVSDRDNPVVARQGDATQAPQVAEVRPNGQPQPFLFWVTFSEGTSQESIDQWVNEMQGHKGALTGGWQAVEIVPPSLPPDRFLEQVRRAKIVKAVRTSR